MFKLRVQNMTCGGCVASVTRAVRGVDPGAAVKVDLESGKVGIDGSLQPADYAAALEQAGFPAAAAPSPAVKDKKGCCCG